MTTLTEPDRHLPTVKLPALRAPQRAGAQLTPKAAISASLKWVEGVLAIGIGLALILLGYTLFAPLPVSQVAPDAASIARPIPSTSNRTNAGEIDPFRTVANLVEEAAPVLDQGPDLAETSLDLVLRGAWPSEEGQSSAIIQLPDGKQARFGVGEEVWRGVTLDEVYAEQVVLLSGGVRESLRMINRAERTTNRGRSDSKRRPSSGGGSDRGNNQVTASASGSVPTATSATPVAGGSAGFELGEHLKVVPQPGANGVRLALRPGDDPSVFNANGLKDGDILVAVDNRRIGSNLVSEFGRLRALANRSSVAVTVERGGVTVPLEIALRKQSEDDD
ncbi:MAG: type II secretion system protein N [Pseudomonadota bacterium]